MERQFIRDKDIFLTCDGEAFSVSPLVLKKLEADGLKLTDNSVVDREIRKKCLILNMTAKVAELTLRKIAGEPIPQLSTCIRLLDELKYGTQK